MGRATLEDYPEERLAAPKMIKGKPAYILRLYARVWYKMVAGGQRHPTVMSAGLIGIISADVWGRLICIQGA